MIIFYGFNVCISLINLQRATALSRYVFFMIWLERLVAYSIWRYLYVAISSVDQFLSAEFGCTFSGLGFFTTRNHLCMEHQRAAATSPVRFTFGQLIALEEMNRLFLAISQNRNVFWAAKNGVRKRFLSNEKDLLLDKQSYNLNHIYVLLQMI